MYFFPGFFYSEGILWTGIISPNVAACSFIWCHLRPYKGVQPPPWMFLTRNYLLPYTSLSSESLDPLSSLVKNTLLFWQVFYWLTLTFGTLEWSRKLYSGLLLPAPKLKIGLPCYYCRCHCSEQPDPGISRHKEKHFKSWIKLFLLINRLWQTCGQLMEDLGTFKVW